MHGLRLIRRISKARDPIPRVAARVSRIAQSQFAVKNHRFMPPFPFSRLPAAMTVALLAAFPLNAADDAPPKDAAPANGPRRAGGGPENPELKFRPPPPPALSPQEEMKTFKVQPGFKVELVASAFAIGTNLDVLVDSLGRVEPTKE